jgi:hypothetical protein
VAGLTGDSLAGGAGKLKWPPAAGGVNQHDQHGKVAAIGPEGVAQEGSAQTCRLIANPSLMRQSLF